MKSRQPLRQYDTQMDTLTLPKRNYKKLFKPTKRTLIKVASCAPSQKAFTNPGEGSYFTIALRDTIEDEVSETDGNINWNAILATTKTKTTYKVRKACVAKQIPVFKVITK